MSSLLHLTKKDEQLLENLFYVKDENILAARYFLHYLINEKHLIKKESLEHLIKKRFSEDDAFTETLLTYLAQDDQQIFSLLSSRIQYGFMGLDEDIYRTNPYYQNIKIDEQKIRSWQLDNERYLPYEGFTYRDIKIQSDEFKELNYFGYFKNEFSYPILRFKNKVWMSITPHEIETMQNAIDKVSGKVAVFGLGLGYFPYMISLKENIDEIVIIEKDKNVIKLFKKYLFSQFPNQNKIKIIHSDAFKYVKKMRKLTYDFAFIDIYQNVDDGLNLYLKMKQLEADVSQTQFIYWIEKSLLAMTRRALLCIFEEDLKGSTNFLNVKGEEGKTLKYLFAKIKDFRFDTYEEIYHFLKDISINEFLKGAN